MSNLIASLRTAIANRRAYNRAIVEIEHLAARELADMNVDRDTLIANVHQQIYGVAR